MDRLLSRKKKGTKKASKFNNKLKREVKSSYNNSIKNMLTTSKIFLPKKVLAKNMVNLKE